jgi:hypothetical protein
MAASSVVYGDYGKVHPEAWTERVSRIAKELTGTEAETEASLMAMLDHLWKRGAMNAEGLFQARQAVVRGVGPKT